MKTFRSSLGHGIELPGIIKVQIIASTGKLVPSAISLTCEFSSLISKSYISVCPEAYGRADPVCEH